jgi:hypothetical protein
MTEGLSVAAPVPTADISLNSWTGKVQADSRRLKRFQHVIVRQAIYHEMLDQLQAAHARHHFATEFAVVYEQNASLSVLQHCPLYRSEIGLVLVKPVHRQAADAQHRFVSVVFVQILGRVRTGNSALTPRGFARG